MNTVNLSGKWLVTYSDQRPEKDFAIPNFQDGIFTDAVPGYWEDMCKTFAMAPFWKNVVFNPDYRPINLPILGNVPDMVLETIVGTFWYKRHLAPVNTDNKRVIFKCTGVQNRALLWINGTFAGEHCGYSAPFEFDITEFLSDKDNNEIVLAVSNHQAYNENGDMISGCTSRAANRFTGGIMGDITLDIKNRDCILDAWVSSYDKTKDSFPVSATLSLEDGFELFWEISKDGKILKSGKSDKSRFEVDKGELAFWSTKNPELYTMTLRLFKDGKEQDFHVFEFGIRCLEANGEKLLFNSKPIFLRGICEHGYFAKTVHPTDDINYYLKAIKTLKELDFNFIRFHTWIPVEEYMTAADRLGILLHVESPNNTTLKEWENIMKFVRRHPSVVICCCGNEMLIDDVMVERLEKCAEIAHREAPGVLFSPINGLRGVEYCWSDSDYGTPIVEKPFKHNPVRLEKLQSFSDVFSSFAHGQLSYLSLDGNPEEIDSWQPLLKLPRISHEICIHGTYPDLALERRYEGTRIGKTDLYTGPRRMLEELGLSDRAALYYNNSCRWQQILRKQTFENARLTKTLAGYDFLGDIDHHWHTSGYRVGMMNEFYELKPGETVENVRRYNSESVLLCDIATNRTFVENSEIDVNFFASIYGGEDIENEKLVVRFETSDRTIVSRFEFSVSAKNGGTSKLANLKTLLPKVKNPTKLRMFARLSSKDYELENLWDIWVFPEVSSQGAGDVIVTEKLTDEILEKLDRGADVLMLGTEGLYSNPVSFRVTFPGRSAGNLATVIENHPMTETFEHDGYCDWQFFSLMSDASCLYYPPECKVLFRPIIDVVSSYKWVRRQSALSEFRVGKGRLIISTFNTSFDNPSSKWWKQNVISYMNSPKFNPEIKITLDDLSTLFVTIDVPKALENSNFAGNINDKTMKR